MAVAPSGVLDGKNATVNHMAIPYAKKLFPNVKWIDDKQWVIDGNLWTAGGAYAGADMIAHWFVTFSLQTHFPKRSLGLRACGTVRDLLVFGIGLQLLLIQLPVF